MHIDETLVITSYQEGKSMNAIANDLHTYTTTIKRILEKNKVPLRHDDRRKGGLYVQNGEALIEWAKSQGRLVTKAELAEKVGRKRLSPSYFLKYPELGKYVKTDTQNELATYYDKLYDWLRCNNIPYKPGDRTKLKVSVDALLLGEYSHIILHIAEKPTCVSKKKHEEALQLRINKADEIGMSILFLNEKHFHNLDELKVLLDSLKH